MNENELYLLLGRIDGKLDAALTRADKNEKSIEALSQRINTLERARSWVLGAAVVAGVVAATIKTYLFHLVGIT